MSKQFYNYTYRDPSRGNEPFYHGKGSDDRSHIHLKRTDKHPFVQRLQKMHRPGIKPIIQRIDVNSEAEAFELERFLISEIGRKDLGKGPLLNLTDGGEGPSGYVQSEELKARRAAATKEALNRPEVKAKHRASNKKARNQPEAKARWDNAIRDAYTRPDVLARRSKASKEAWDNPVARARRSAQNKETSNRPEEKARRSAAIKGWIPANHPLYKGASPTGNLLRFFR